MPPWPVTGHDPARVYFRFARCRAGRFRPGAPEGFSSGQLVPAHTMPGSLDGKEAGLLVSVSRAFRARSAFRHRLAHGA